MVAYNFVTLLFGGECDVPMYVAKCPECSSQLRAVSEEWEMEAGLPTMSLLVGCKKNMEHDEIIHRYWQRDWQPVIDVVQRYFLCVKV
jgi:hypothetical protein